MSLLNTDMEEDLSSPPSGGRMSKNSRLGHEEPPDNPDVPVETMDIPKLSFRDSLMGSGNETVATEEIDEEDEFVVGEDDAIRIHDDIETKIFYKERILKLAEKSMSMTVVVKLLGRPISYDALQNRLFSLWRPRGQIHMMDLDNDYFQVSLTTSDDYQRALTGGPWIVYGHILTVQPWSASFSPLQPYPSNVVVWVRVRSIPGAFYKKHLVFSIGSMIGKVVKVDDNTCSATRGRFVRLAVTVDLSKNLKSRVWVNGRAYDIEYESLPLICYEYGRYDHLKADCNPIVVPEAESETVAEKTDEQPTREETTNKEEVPAKANFGPLMVVPKRTRKPTNTDAADKAEN